MGRKIYLCGPVMDEHEIRFLGQCRFYTRLMCIDQSHNLLDSLSTLDL